MMSLHHNIDSAHGPGVTGHSGRPHSPLHAFFLLSLRLLLP
ncbi:MAG TPA: hypothetical protein VKA13_04805 [Gammaproteobacteria bacterium]|nr:hypothetical protein [Gammaproteobacteria bacterium]